jgi:hypothetical protein
VKYTSSDSVDVALIAKLFGVPNVYIASGSLKADDNSTSDVWGTDVVLAYVPKNGTYLTPAYGYTYWPQRAIRMRARPGGTRNNEFVDPGLVRHEPSRFLPA